MQRLEINRIRIVPPAGQMRVDTRKQIGVASLRRDIVEARRQEDDRRLVQLVPVGVARRKKAVGHHRIGRARRHGRIALVQRRHRYGLVVQVATRHQLGEEGLLDPALQNGDAPAGKIGERLHLEAGRAVNLGPAAGDRNAVEIVALGTLAGKGHIGHQIELPLLQLLEAARPLTPDIVQLPAFVTRHRIQQLDEQAGRPAVCVGVDLGCILVEPHLDDPSSGRFSLAVAPLPRCGGQGKQHGQCRNRQQETVGGFQDHYLFFNRSPSQYSLISWPG